MIIESWTHLHKVMSTMTEEELRFTINYEASVYKRRTILERLHQRYTKVRAMRERAELLEGTGLL